MFFLLNDYLICSSTPLYLGNMKRAKWQAEVKAFKPLRSKKVWYPLWSRNGWTAQYEKIFKLSFFLFPSPLGLIHCLCNPITFTCHQINVMSKLFSFARDYIVRIAPMVICNCLLISSQLEYTNRHTLSVSWCGSWLFRRYYPWHLWKFWFFFFACVCVYIYVQLHVFQFFIDVISYYPGCGRWTNKRFH